MNKKVLTDADLAEYWQIEGTPEAIAKRFQRLRALPKSNPRHLKSFTIGNQRRYRIEDIEDWEQKNTKNFLQSLSNFSETDADDLDTAAGIGEKPNYP